MSLLKGDATEASDTYGETLGHHDVHELGSDDGWEEYDGDDLEDDISFDGTSQQPPQYEYVLHKPLCVVCDLRPAYSRGGKNYPTCGLTCAGILEQVKANVAPSPIRIPMAGGGGGGSPINRRASSHSSGGGSPAPRRAKPTTIEGLTNNMGNLSFRRNQGTRPLVPQNTGGSRIANAGAGTTTTTITGRQPAANLPVCVVCVLKPCRDSKYVTCGLTCAEKLAKTGSADSTMCNYCHRRPKVTGHNQCGTQCRESAKFACLLCKTRPKYKRYHLCGKTCKQIATKSTPLILEAPPGHVTYELVENKFKSAWKYPGSPIPPIKKIYKIIENNTFLMPYDRYKKTHGNEVFRYHGTTRRCTLGSPGNTQLCTNTGCALCSILKTSFKTSLANPSGAFGAGIYSSSAANKAYSYTGSATGAMLLTKVVLGKVRPVSAWNEVMSCPPGFNSVVFDRQGGSLNETIVYTDDAIRPVFLIIF